MENNKLISIVVPMYNEEEGLHHFLEVLHSVLTKVDGYSFEIVVVNDGSKDKTFELLQQEQQNYEGLVLVNLSRNFGHESAVAAGLKVASGEAVIPMDADLQDPPEIIPDLIERYEDGFDVVNAKRASRKDDTAFKRNTAGMFYKLIAKMSGKVKVEENVGHFRLMSRRVVDQVIALNDYTRVLRVEVPYVGFKTTRVEFVRAPRTAGKTHYNLESMTDLALDSIISTTPKPLKLVKFVGIAMCATTFLSFVAHLVFCILYWCDVYHNVLGIYTWLAINVMMFLASLVLLVLAVMAEYEARTFQEAQKRPFFIIESIQRKK